MADASPMVSPTQGVDQAGFINGALNAVPRWAAASIGTMIGAAIAVVFVLVIGGMQGPVTRIANAYAARIEGAASKVDASALILERNIGVLSDIVKRLNTVEMDSRRITARIDDHEARISRIENRRRVIRTKAGTQ
jgi:hypothetical protein